jgi:hypothetical protein
MGAVRQEEPRAWVLSLFWGKSHGQELRETGRDVSWRSGGPADDQLVGDGGHDRFYGRGVMTS